MDELVRRWEEAERRLYSSMLAQPDRVAEYMRVARALADDLRDVRTVEALAEAWGRGLELAEAAARRHSMAAPDLGTLAGAGFSLRYREVLQERAAARSRRLIEEATARGEEWVVLLERGSADDPSPPYERLEMRLRDGLGVHSWVELDPDAMVPVYTVEMLRADPETGRVTGSVPDTHRTFAAPDEWRRAVQQARGSRLTGRPAGEEDCGR